LPPTPPRRLNDRRWRLGLVLVLVLVTVAVTAALGPPAPAAQSPSSPATGPAASPGTARLAAGSAYQVTLLTGDVVSLHGRKDGAPDVRIRPAARPSGDKPSFQITTSAQGTHVIPADVAPLVPGTLDPALFDVTSLVAQGYDDRHASGLPLLVRSSQPAARRGSLGALAAGEPAAARQRPTCSAG